MRTYYIADLPRFPNVEGDIKLQKLANAFSTKHAQIHWFEINLLFGPRLRLNSLYVYCEDDRAYEFFTGIEIGKLQCTSYVHDSITHYSYIINHSNFFSHVSASNTSEDYFARCIGELLPYRHHVKKALDEYFRIHQLIKNSEDKRLRKIADKEASRNKKNVEKLERILEKRQ